MQQIDDASAPGLGLQSDLISNISHLLDVLLRVGAGESLEQLEMKYPESHPVGALTSMLNQMITSLAEARAQSAKYSSDLKDKIAAIEAQEAAIAELQTPILEVWEGVLCMPIVGIVDSMRTADMARTLLQMIVQTKARLALIDITGIQVMDTRAVDHFLRMARAVRLLGARAVLSGVHPNVSQTIVHMGMDLRGIETHRSMRDALRHFVSAKSDTAEHASAESQPTVAEAAPTSPDSSLAAN